MLLLTPKYIFLVILSQYDYFLFCHFQDVQFGDIDYMIRMKDFTYDPVNFKGLPDFVRSIRKDGLRYIIILVSIIFCLSVKNRQCTRKLLYPLFSESQNEANTKVSQRHLNCFMISKRTSLVCNNVICVSFCIHGVAIIKTLG